MDGAASPMTATPRKLTLLDRKAGWSSEYPTTLESVEELVIEEQGDGRQEDPALFMPG
jgi:hypothetical protein